MSETLSQATLTRDAGDLTLAVEHVGDWYDAESRGLRQQYTVTIRHTDGRTYVGAGYEGIRSGVGRDVDLPDAMSALVSFLSAAVESGPDGGNGDLFPAWLIEAADADELAMMACEFDGEEW